MQAKLNVEHEVNREKQRMPCIVEHQHLRDNVDNFIRDTELNLI